MLGVVLIGKCPAFDVLEISFELFLSEVSQDVIRIKALGVNV